MTIKLTKRQFAAGAALAGAGVFMPAIGARAQAKVVRWGIQLPASHPQVLMMERIAKEVKDKTSGRIDVQLFPNGQLGAGKDMMEAVSAGAQQMTTDGAAALGAFLPQLSIIEAPYLWRDAAHMAKVSATPLFNSMNNDLVSKRGMRMIAVTYYGKRHLTTGSKQVKSAADMAGFKLRVPPVDTFRAMAEAWGARATPVAFPELYLSLSQGAVDGQENPLPTIQSAKLFEVQKFLVLTEHIITPQLVIVNEAFWKGLPAADRDLLQASIDSNGKWQDAELTRQEDSLVDTLKKAGMTVIEPDMESFRKPVLAQLPPKFEDKWGKGNFEALLKL